ncbi:MAG: TonB-dependent receptor [Candidatus Aminicenantes bacterium]|jgi:vitamin B12 transporter
MKNLIFVLVISLLMVAPVLCTQKTKENQKQQEEETKTGPKRLKYHIVVTATRTEQPKLELGSSTTLIPFEDLKQAGKETVAEALTAVPGLDVVQNGGAGKTADVFIRGANSEHTLVMVDGVEVNDPMSPGRTFDFAHLSLDNIDRIEIVRGPQSTLYGSDAMGGVINIITKKGEGKSRVFISAETGSYGTFREAAGVSGETGTANYSLEISRFDSKGFSESGEKYGNTEKDGYGNTTLSGRLGFKPAKNLEFNLISRYITARNDLDNFAGAGGDDPNYITAARQFLLAANSRLSLLKGKWEQRLGISYNYIHRDLTNPTDQYQPFDSQQGLYKGRIFKIDWQHNLYLHPTNTVTAGIEHEREWGKSVYTWESMWGPGESLFPGKSARTTGFYLQDSIKIRDTFFMTLGVRFDNHSRFGNETTYRIAPAVLLKSGTKLKATYGTGFKAPSLYQLYAPATAWGPVGNQNLEPERSKGWDAGIEQFLFEDRLTLSFTYFQNDFEDLILYDFIQGYINISQAETKGYEIFMSTRPHKDLTIHGSYTYTDAKDRETGEQLLRRPKHKANLTFNLRLFKRANVNLFIIHIGKRLDLFPYPTITEADAYTLFNLAASYRLSKNIEVFGRIDNLFNREYEAVLGYGTPGRSAYIGIKATY